MIKVNLLDDGAPHGSLTFDASCIRRFTDVEPHKICLHRAPGPERARVEAYIDAAYAAAFKGLIRHHHPVLISVQDEAGAVHAAAGFRLARDGALFLEHYLDEPIEQAVSRRAGRAVSRAEFAEIGNLASQSRGASVLLFLALAGVLDGQGCTHAAATATRQLRRGFERAGFQTERLALADPRRLPDNGVDWGAYYERDPDVRVGAIGASLPGLGRMLTGGPCEPPRAHRRTAARGNA